MKSILITAVVGSAFVLAACQPAGETVDKKPEMTADKAEMAKEIVGKCEYPNEKRDVYLLQQIEKGNDPKVIAETGAAFEKRGADLSKSGSYQNYLAIVTGKPHPFGPQQAADYNACLDQHR